MSHNNFKYFLLNKPYGVLSQFTDKDGRKTLSDFYSFPKDVYSVGRLDMDSEGLLLLTDDKGLTDFLLNPLSKHEKEYYVQVEGIPDGLSLEKLRNGVILEEKKTLPAKVRKISDPLFPERIPPVRERKNIPTSWLSISITEGRNRQVRRMTANVGHPTLRLVRVKIKNLLLNELPPGKVRELTCEEIDCLKKQKP
ncbi:MAG: pseudouridine synthase [Ignavibacteriaceae bacterium]|jgi:23S rRNA pseudouridine2457 synthase